MRILFEGLCNCKLAFATKVGKSPLVNVTNV